MKSGKHRPAPRRVIGDDSSAGGHAAAFPPPAYGIDFVDAAGAVQREAQPAAAPNLTGMPDGLKSGLESLSGMNLSDVRVNFNSPKPAQLNAHAYTQGNAIHVAPGQEKHLPHEAWHVVQQRQGRVQPTTELNGAQINDDAGLEREADLMGGRAAKGD
jgi:hypothetical protein